MDLGIIVELNSHLLWLETDGTYGQTADLREANLDFASWPLHCRSFAVKVDDRLVSQLVMHVARLDTTWCSAPARYAHRFIFTGWAGKFLANQFCKFRSDIKGI